MNCPECRQPFTRKRSDQGFCSVACGRAEDKRALKRARAVYRALYHWRLKRSHPLAADDLRFVCREIAAWHEEDRQAQRLPPPRHNHGADRGHQRREVSKVITRAAQAAIARHVT